MKTRVTDYTHRLELMQAIAEKLKADKPKKDPADELGKNVGNPPTKPRQATLDYTSNDFSIRLQSDKVDVEDLGKVLMGLIEKTKGG